MLDFLKKISSIFPGRVFNQKTSVLDSLSHVKEESQEVQFARKFSFSGGRFLYCESSEQALNFLKKIVDENSIDRFWCPDTRLQIYLRSLSLASEEIPDKQYFNLIFCEHLIAKDGSVMLSSDQMGGRKLFELSGDFVILASSSQIVDTIDDALRRIKAFKSHRIPNNITTIRGNEPGAFHSESQKKNIYLLLIDDV